MMKFLKIWERKMTSTESLNVRIKAPWAIRLKEIKTEERDLMRRWLYDGRLNYWKKEKKLDSHTTEKKIYLVGSQKGLAFEREFRRYRSGWDKLCWRCTPVTFFWMNREWDHITVDWWQFPSRTRGMCESTCVSNVDGGKGGLRTEQ